MRDQEQRKLRVPWNWIAVSAALALLAAALLGPPPVPLWSSWLGLFVLFGSGALILAWCRSVIVYPVVLVGLFSFTHCIGPIYCYWFPDVLDSFVITEKFRETFIFCQLSSLMFLLAVAAALAATPLTGKCSQTLSTEVSGKIRRWSVTVYVAAVLIQGLQSRINLVPAGLDFVVFLIGDLRHVAICTLILLGPPRQALLWFFVGLGVQTYEAMGGMLGSLLASVLTYAVFLTFSLRKRSVILNTAFLALVLSLPMQAVKSDYRQVVWESGGRYGLLQRLNLIGNSLAGIRFEVSIRGQEALAGPFFVRMNHARIVEHVIVTVPEVEPYAKGETLWQGVLNIFKIRIFAPEKTRVGGKSSFTRFTQHELTRVTSMDIGILGEAYANFGFRGGLLYIAAFMVAFGMLWRIIYVRFSKAPLGFVWIPYVLGHWNQGETVFSDVLEYAVKALVIVALVVWLEPAWRRALMRPPLRASSKRQLPARLRKPVDAEAP
jgi:hypothetical protein